MGKMAASPADLARTLSLQRANARAKSCISRADQRCSSDQRELSKRIDVLLLTSIPSTTSANNMNGTGIGSCNVIDDDDDDDDSQMNNAIHLPSCKESHHLLDHDGTTLNAIKRSFSADISNTATYKACFSSLSERIDRGLDLWDREFSSMSSYVSDQDGILSGLHRRLINSHGSFNVCGPIKGRQDACSSNGSWSEEESLADATLQMEEEEAGSSIKAAFRYGLGMGSDCTLQGHSVDTETISEGKYDIEDERSIGSKIDTRSRSGTQGESYNGSCTSRRPTYGRGADSFEGRAAELPANSVAVEKVSVNPVVDFRESMYEMMMEKDMEEECGDMEDLLNCYLLLNPSELHDVIREVFSHVWIDIIMTVR